MAESIAVTSGKGGTGKSSICAGLGYVLAKQGYRTLIVELDFGLRCLDIMLGVKDAVKNDIGTYIENRCKLIDAITPVKSASNLFLMAAPKNPYVELESEQIFKICNEMKKYYDYIIIDSSAGISRSIFDITASSDLVLIVTTPDPVCIRDGQTISDEIYERNNERQRLLINQFDRKTFDNNSIEDFDEIIDTIGIQLIGVIPKDVKMVEALQRGKTIPQSCPGFKALDAISKRILGQDIPLTIKANV